MRTARKTTHEAAFSAAYGSFGRVAGSFDEELARAMRSANSEPGKLPPWFPKFPGSEQIETVPAITMLEFLVCGDPSRNKVQVLAGNPGTAIREVRLPPRWDALMEQAGYRPLQEFVLKQPFN